MKASAIFFLAIAAAGILLVVILVIDWCVAMWLEWREIKAMRVRDAQLRKWNMQSFDHGKRKTQ